jgi:hypothetical protein
LEADPRLFEWEILDRIGSWGEARQWPTEQIVQERSRLEATLKSFWAEVVKAGGPPVEATPAPFAPPEMVERPPVGVATAKGKGSYLLVFTRDRKAAKLHKMNGCQWTQVKLADAQEVSNPLPEMYSSRCKLCWPGLLAKVGEPAEDVLSSDSEL